MWVVKWVITLLSIFQHHSATITPCAHIQLVRSRYRSLSGYAQWLFVQLHDTSPCAPQPSLQIHNLLLDARRHAYESSPYAMQANPKCSMDNPLVARARKRSKALVESIHRLVWADGFQDKLLKIYYGPLGYGLGAAVLKEVSAEVAAEIEKLTCDLVQELSGWTHRNQLLSSVERESLPSIGGCKANLETAQIMQKLFAEDIEFFFTHSKPDSDEARFLSPAERRIRVCFTAVHERFQALVASASDACDDVEARWHAEMAVPAATTHPIPAIAATNNQGQPPDVPMESKRARAKKSLKNIIGFVISSGKKASSEEQHQSEPDDSTASHVGGVISEPYNTLHWHGPGSRPCLSALPRAPLEELKRRQTKLREDRRRSPQNRATEHASDIAHELHEEQQSGAGEEKKDEASRPASETEVSSAPGRSSHGAGGGEEEVVEEEEEEATYTKTEAEILELLGGTMQSLPEAENDPEKRKSWWHQRALRDLEGDR
ncbi:hypothetical protein HDK77DRAFT_223327 [Phyllosticta capitalensis]